MRTPPIGGEALYSREASFRALARIIERDSRLKNITSQIRDEIERAEEDGNFTVEVSGFQFPASERLQGEHMKRIMNYFTQQGYYIESRPQIAKGSSGEEKTTRIDEGYFLAWDHATLPVRK